MLRVGKGVLFRSVLIPYRFAPAHEIYSRHLSNYVYQCAAKHVMTHSEWAEVAGHTKGNSNDVTA